MQLHLSYINVLFVRMIKFSGFRLLQYFKNKKINYKLYKLNGLDLIPSFNLRYMLKLFNRNII